MSEQFSFDLRRRPALNREDYFASASNALALTRIDETEAWPTRRLVLSGPQASGKTHLAHVWAASQGATLLHADGLDTADMPGLSAGPVALDEADWVAGDHDKEERLFHLYNLMNAAQQPLLMTARTPPAAWGLTLPDLASRMEATDRAALEAPDDALLTAVLMKQLGERDLDIDPDVIAYATARMERSFAVAQALAERLNQEAFSRRRKVTKPLIREVLAALDVQGN